jgi:hypothetical protein
MTATTTTTATINQTMERHGGMPVESERHGQRQRHHGYHHCRRLKEAFRRFELLEFDFMTIVRNPDLI